MPRHCAEYDAASGTWRRRDLTPAEEAVRDADHARHLERLANPPRERNLLAEIDALEARLATLEAKDGNLQP